MLIKSSTTLRNEYDKIVGLSKARQEPVYITRNGEGEMVFLPIEAYERREAELTLLEKLLMAEQNTFMIINKKINLNVKKDKQVGVNQIQLQTQ